MAMIHTGNSFMKGDSLIIDVSVYESKKILYEIFDFNKLRSKQNITDGNYG